jgi:hypothetical protein
MEQGWLADLVEATAAWVQEMGYPVGVSLAMSGAAIRSGAEHEVAYYS